MSIVYLSMKIAIGSILKTISLILALICFYSATGQTPSYRKPIVYKVWIKLSNSPVVSSGVLYEIGDSLITVSNSLSDTSQRIYNFYDIETLKIRRMNSLTKGRIVGSSVGIVGGIVAVNSIEGGLDFLTIPVSAVAGLYFGAFGAGFGILAGSIKDRIEIKSNYENFDKYRGNLQDYSFILENIPAKKTFNHRGYIEATFGLSFAQDEFIQRIPFNGYLGMRTIGSSLNISGGYRFNELIGLSASLINNMYPVKFTKDYSSLTNLTRNVSWSLDVFQAGPVISLPLSTQLRINLTPGIGYASAILTDDNKFVLNGKGLAFHINGTLLYNYSKRWFASAGLGYLSSKQTYMEGGSGHARSIDIRFGLAYKFGRKSL